jgi:hypothetical protein
MAHTQVVIGDNGLQMWRIVMNILNKQSWAANKGCPPTWDLGGVLKTPHHKNPSH